MLAVVNGFVLTVLGALYLIFASWPAGLIIGSVLIAAACLLLLLPTLDRYRRR